ncbi:E3 ubiquitin-protein ligase rnf213-alpha isoform X3 [Pangasianodon hypophthalmus]|uniref:E3 ubiquitin-protein ligase rnf213-alpha isoform X3 n=1 Tax=Pangasianodon hypophthalmus TaxID=310915 RepID=UPI002307ABA1|nr:E3 ubiquitin-protein ligase rnf213-alpha isoform X3 [Pangasianodon hypophthalmus]
MKCPKCNHVALEETAKFCSQCGTALTAQLSEKTQSMLSKQTPDGSTQSAVIPHATDVDMKTETNPDSSVLDNRQTAGSPKRPNDNSPNVKKKKKKKKKKRRASGKDGGPVSLTSDLSDISLTDKDIGRTQEEAVSSDSEDSVCPMDETPDLNLDTSAQAEGQTSVSPESSLVNPSEEKTGDPMTLEEPALPEADANKNLASGEPGELQDQKSQGDEEPAHLDSDSSLPSSSETEKQEQLIDRKKPKHEVQKDAFKTQNQKGEPNSMQSQQDESKKSQSKKDESKKSQSQKDDSKKSQSQKDDSKKSQSEKDESKKSQSQKDDSKKSQSQKDESKKSQSQKDESKKSQSQKDESKNSESQKDASNKTQNQKDASNKLQSQKDASNKTQSQNDSSSKTQPILDQNANVDQSANAKAEPCTQKTKSLNQEGKKSGMVFGPQSEEVQSLGSSVDPQLNENNQPLQSAQGKGDHLSGQRSPVSKRENKSEETVTRKDGPPERIPTSTQQLSSSERLTIYFHAVLSKDFKFDQNEDRIFIKAGPPISDWEKNLVELSVTRDLDEHGFLVEGSLLSTKFKAEAVSIPYKYVVYKEKKQKYEFEYIYKMDSNEPTNRCLFVKRHLLNAEGEWHQYDDIICAEPSKSVFKRIKNTLQFWTEQRKNVIEGREIAGRVMLETIFDFLRSWTDINLRNFITQLKQFHQIYGNPFVYEEKEKKWSSLNYTEKDVSNLIKNFMVEHVTPELQKDGSSKKSEYIKDPLKAAIIMLYLWKQYDLKLERRELNCLCSALCLPNLPKDEFLPFWTNIQESFSCLKNLPDTLVDLINTVKGEGMTRWIVAIPLLHLLKGTSKPFEPVSLTVNPKNEQAWAGLQGLKLANTKSFTSQDRRSMLNLMKANRHLVEVDTLLARSWMFLISVDELVECSTNIHVELSDMLQLFILKAPADIFYSNSSVSNVSDTLTFIQSQLLEQKYSCFSDDYGRNCLSAAVKLLEKICKGVKSSYKCTDIPVACLNLVVSVSEFAQSLPEQEIQEKDCLKAIEKRSKILELLSVALKTVRTWIGQTFKDNLLQHYTLSANLTSEIEMWNNIISISFESEEFTKEWRDTFTRDFEGKFQQESSIDQIEVYCSRIEELNDTHPHVARSVEKCALQAVTSMCQAKTEARLFERCKINWKFGKLISAIIQKSWPKTESGSYHEREEVVLQHLLNWTAAKNIFQLHGADEKLIDQLSEEAKERLAMATSLFTNISDQLIRGSIRIKVLNHILAKKNTFTELVKIDCLCENEKCKDASAMRRLLQLRQDEVKAIYHDSELVKGLIAMCRNIQEHVTVDLGDLEAKHQINIDEMELNKFMEVHPFDQIASPMAGVVTYFDLHGNIRNMAEILHSFKESYIFKICWESQAEEFARRAHGEYESDDEDDLWATTDLIYEDIFQPCYSKYREIYESLKDGSMTFEEVDVLFKAYIGKYVELAQDATIMSKLDPADDKRWIQRRIQQIEQYHELHLAVESAHVVMMVKEALGLQGDFQVLEKLLTVTHLDFKTEPLDSIDNELMQAKTVLVDITEPRRLCLQELGLRRNFVMWVKEALEDINELKVFVDLASISAGENDLDVDRVACFHDAVLGYSSMLYELKSDTSFVVFKEVLKKLWKALDNDPNLPKKLRDTARHLEWLKTVKDSHGSVELSSLSLASAINTKGIYIISAENQKKLSLDKVLKLRIPEEHDEGHEMRCYSLEDLRDLQNKLMLMSGKGEQGQNEVDRFAEVFASVQRLGSAFIDLFVAGNPLFRLWEAIIHCNSEEACIVMDFNLSSVVSVVMVKGDVAEQLLEVCKKMERCLSFWKDFIDKQRSQNYYLNYFTAEQIVYLCSQLTQKNLGNLDNEALMMLSFIKPNCTTFNLRQSWHVLQYEILTKPSEQNEDIDFQTFVDVPNQIEYEMDIEGVSASDFGPENDTRRFDIIWNMYMRNMKNFLPNSLDVRSLGRLLEILSDSPSETEVDADDVDESDLEKHKKYVQRELPRGLVTGKPNLIICPLTEIQTSCISIYMSSEDEPLPTYDEVLLCDSSTSYERVELFLRRCLTAGYRGQKIYTMLYVDQLTYEVSYKVEQFFQRHKAQSRNDYRLVLICSTDREHAYLPSVFSQFRLHMVPQEPLSRIQKYLAKHYTVPKDYSSAAAVFKNKFVGVVSSRRAGVGKSLYVHRLYERLKLITKKPSQLKCIRLIEPRVDENAVLQSMLNSPKRELTIFHFDVTSSVQKGLHEFLFRLLVLGYLLDSEGRMWKCSNRHLYIIELLQSSANVPRNGPRSGVSVQSAFQDVFPIVYCRTPKEVLELEMRMSEDPCTAVGDDPLMDDKEFRSEAYQRPYQYLKRFHLGQNLDGFLYRGIEGTHVECLQLLFLYCGVMDPSWAELRNFTWFLNLQLRDCETSVFCDASFTGDTLQGFKNFVVDFMILMAKDFATPSLSISDQSPGRQQMDISGVSEEDLAPFRMRKRWESEPHPYIFFNDDHVSMTFIGFHLQPNDQNWVDAINPSTKRVIKKNIMTQGLYEGLRLQRVPFNIDFDNLPRGEKIERICNVLGIQWPLDPDETYELTTDNILKILAIHMRFRCGIPVIIMGETGCGKTRLIKFLCELRRSGVATENMKLVKVHGGTSSDMIYTKVREAESIAYSNKQDYGFDSVLFFDEANTTEAISTIKEVLCDKTVEGESMMPNTGLQIIAACNPYRKHTDVMIKRLESAGLGYRVRAEETDEKLGSIPLRQLVYRVQALPPSMIPLVWDFGQLNDHTEKMYIQQIVQRLVENHSFPEEYIKIITDVLSASQKYMRTRNDECSFVSLRDVERCMQVFAWFYQNNEMLLSELARYESNQRAQKNEYSLRDMDERDPILWSLVMAIGVCYHACLEDKEKYRNKICKYFPRTYSPVKLMQEISVMQDLLLSGVPLGETIARNNALKENVFMMVICIELRIPLFLVGKPGSSKSLSKTLVADAMQGQAAHSDLFRKLKQIHLVSFQCSPHSTPEGIINTFKQCARFQEGKNLNEYISVVVLDEIGLAEDSPKMPLKTLHPLLEEGCIDDQPLPHKKVGFIGISNWALDPAKMNRGIFVSRGDPDEKELIESAKGICSSDAMILEKVRDFFQPFARAYLKICKKEGKGFFGLRDYYSLIKMMFAIAKATDQKPSADQIVVAVLRNFSGKDTANSVTVFTDRLVSKPNLESIDTIELVRQNITAIAQDEECRYLLILTKNYAALQILQQTFFSEQYQPEIIFGSSFPKDQQYTQICRNINRVKICMETGQTIVLLNLQNLYESLYDALNQYYVCLGGQKYVDLGLGTHRVKCRVHKDFRLIVIEEREVVYKQFPIPLINRLEKHYLDINTVLKNEQKQLVKILEKWVGHFITSNSQHSPAPQAAQYCPADVFIGYHSDTCASVILQVIERQKGEMELPDPQRQLLDEAKLILLNCATPDAVVRLDSSALSRVESEHLARVYFEDQKHSCMADFVLSHIQQEEWNHASFTEVTTFSRLLTAADIEQLQEVVPNIELLSLQQFDTEHSFLKKIRNFLDSTSGNKILIIQTDFDEALQSSNLIASAKYSSIGEINKLRKEQDSKVFVYFITKLPRVEGGTSYVGFHGGPWKSVHIDDLRRSKDIISDIKVLQSLTISQLFEEKEEQPEAMETEDMYREEGAQKMEQEDNISWENVLDTTALVRSCVQSAVGMLRDQGDAGCRSTRRVEILLTLLSDSEELQATFLKTIKRRLHSVLMNHDEHTLSAKNWVFKEASNIDSLQEGGTFRNTLWKRVQAAVIPSLAQLVSVIDRDHNLDILLDRNSGESVKKLWLDIFGNVKLLNVPYTRVDSNSVTKTILVQNCIVAHRKTGCFMPFSWIIRDHLEDLWVHALHREGHTLKQFEEFFRRTPLGRYIAEAEEEMQVDFFHRYLQDFVSLTTNVTTEVEQKLLAEALICCVNELRSRQEAEQNEVTSLPWIHAAYHEFKNRLQNFSRMITIEPQIAQVLLGNAETREGMEMVLDVYAAMACVEYLEPQGLDVFTDCLAWLRNVKKLQVPVELVCSEESIRHYGERSKTMTARVQRGWRRIHALSLFVEHILLDIEDVEKNLKPLVLEHTRKLAQVLDNNSDLKMKQPFEAVITILKTCKDGANDRIFRFGFQPCPVCMGDPHDPLSLPCDHIYCLACIKQWLVPGQMYCPLCMHVVDDDFGLKPSETIRSLIKKNGQFRKQCNAFFIDLVSTICFRDNSPPNKAIILHLLSFLMVEAGSVPMIRGCDRRFLTKALSPFDDSVDKNPVVRSVVLKLLLKYSFADVKDYLQQHLTGVEQSNILEKADKTELYCLYINCLEDSMFDRTQWHSVTEQQACLLEEKNFLMEFLQTGAVATETVTIEHLQQVARTRLCLDMAADLLVNRSSTAAAQKESSPGVAAFLDSVQDMCKQSRNDWYRVYLIRKICSLYGVEYVQKLLNEDQLSWLFPQEILQMRKDSSQIDQYLVCGVEYKAIRDAVAKALLEGKMERIEEAFEICRCSPVKKNVYILLALFREVTTLYRANNPNSRPKPEQLAALEDFSKNSKVFLTPESRVFAQALVHNQLPALQLHPNLSGDEYVVLELTVHLAAVLLCANHAVVEPLLQLAFFPANMQRAFLPTMPDDMLAVAQQAMGQLQWYYCPKGHPCTVGECGQPMEKSRCLDCNEEIGGIDHRPVTGFRILAVQGDRTQTGHILGDPHRRDQPDMQDTKSMSPAPFTLLRMLTHMTMLLGASNQPQALTTIIKPPVAQPGVFLMAHLLKDIEQLIRALGKGADDTVCTVHLTICSLLEPHQPSQRPVAYNNLLSTKDARNNWEMTMANDIITSQLKVLDTQLAKVNTFIRDDERVSSNPVMKVMFGEPRLFLRNLPQGSLIHGSSVWSCRQRVSLLGLGHILEQNGGRDTLPVLWKFLQKEAELRLVKFLPDILALQKDLVKKFQNATELQSGTIAQFLQNLKAVSLITSYEKRINIFLSTWNQLRGSLATNGEIKLPAEYCQEDLDLSADLQVLLPRRQGLGLCSTALVSYLIALHNDLIYAVDKYTGEVTSYTVSPADLTELHVIRYEVERDLLPLVLSNCQYSMERGRETLSEYDLPKIQQQLLTRFLQGKPFISLNGIPTLVNRHDRNYENIFQDVKSKVQQEALSSLSQSTLSVELQSYSDVCEALSTVEVALGFLAMTGGEPNMQLGDYLKEELQMADHIAQHVLKALSRCCLKHCVALWQLLTSLKSETMLRLKRDPFVGISKEYKKTLGEEEKRLLTGFFTKTSADSFLLEMHEFLLLVLKHPNATDTYKPNWSVKDTVGSYMERKDMDVPPDVEELFPDEILLAQYIEAWKFSILLKQERMQR